MAILLPGKQVISAKQGKNEYLSCISVISILYLIILLLQLFLWTIQEETLSRN
jgi:hypothetical protein